MGLFLPFIHFIIYVSSWSAEFFIYLLMFVYLGQLGVKSDQALTLWCL